MDHLLLNLIIHDSLQPARFSVFLVLGEEYPSLMEIFGASIVDARGSSFIPGRHTPQVCWLCPFLFGGFFNIILRGFIKNTHQMMDS